MKSKTAKVLPKTAELIRNGGVYEQSVKCGKPTCKCARGELHAGFYYFFTRKHGKLIKTYIRKAELKQFIEFFHNATEERKRFTRFSKESTELFKKFRLSLRENESFINSLKGNSKL